MGDLFDATLQRLHAHRLPGLSLPEDAIHPAYHGGSVLNLPATLCRLLGAPPIGAAGALDPGLLAPLGERFRRVVLVVVDALAAHRLQRWMDEGQAGVWAQAARRGVFAPLTSVVPSTTAAAITSLWTGAAPAQHGITGYEMWLKEYGVVINSILHAPMSFSDGSGLQRAGLTPEQFMPLPTLGPHLLAAGIPTHVFQYYGILNSGLSNTLFKDVQFQPFTASADLWVNLRQDLEKTAGEPLYAYVYWSDLDTLAHRYGPDDERGAADFALLTAGFERLLLDRLSPAARQDTLLILTADHGAATTRPDPHYDLNNHPSLARRLHILPTGEHRLFSLYVKPGQVEAVSEYLERTWPRQFTQLNPAYAVDAGLFGPGEPHPSLLDRLGDLLVGARGSAYLWWAAKENRMVGRHGGLNKEEMLVPFLAFPLSE